MSAAMPSYRPGVTEYALDSVLPLYVSDTLKQGIRYFGRRIYNLSDLLQEGDNALEIRVTTTLGNYLKTLSREENPTTWIYVNHPRRDQPLQPQGLVGPVKLFTI